MVEVVKEKMAQYNDYLINEFTSSYSTASLSRVATAARQAAGCE